jgi:HIV Tat-specific factor 1
LRKKEARKQKKKKQQQKKKQKWFEAKMNTFVYVSGLPEDV